MGQRRTYTREFKCEAVELARTSGKSMAALERELGLSQGILKQWVGQAQQGGVGEIAQYSSKLHPISLRHTTRLRLGKFWRRYWSIDAYWV
jgi:transposase-like protein